MKQLQILLIALCVTSSLAVLKTFSNPNGGAWDVSGNWEPSGVPQATDDVYFTYIDGMNSDMRTVPLNGDITVNSFVIDFNVYRFQAGSLTVTNDCRVEGGVFYKINITLNGNANFSSSGSGFFSGIGCDSCTIHVKKFLEVSNKNSGNMELANNAMIINYEGATTNLFYGAFHSAVTQVGTLVNYGTLNWGNSFYLGSSPWGVPPVTETGPWQEIKNYGDVGMLVTGSRLPTSPLYNDISIWNFYSGKLTLSLVQPSTTNADGVWSGNYEYNDVVASGGSHDYYEVNMGGDVHIIFTSAGEVDAGQPEKPFNPKVGDFFPVFANFDKQTGQIKTLTFEGLGAGMALGRKTRVDPQSQLFHVGVIICASTDTTCINGETQSPGTQTPGSQSPSSTQTPITSQSPSGQTPTASQSPSGQIRSPDGKLVSSANFVELSVMAVFAVLALLF